MKVAFICKANVQRSQISEWLFRKLYPNIQCISFAWIEARKEKYSFKTEKSVSKIAQDYDNIDIGNQNINYISDFSIEEKEFFQWHSFQWADASHTGMAHVKFFEGHSF